MPEKEIILIKASGPSSQSTDEEHVRETVILFADIMGASEVSNHTTPGEYFHFVQSFQETFKKTCRDYLHGYDDTKGAHFISSRGDEGLLMIFPERDGNTSMGTHVDSALHIAFALKRQWFSNPRNRERIKDKNLLPIDIGIGIHLGRTWVQKLVGEIKDKAFNPKNVVLEGYAINLAKRIESHSRKGRYTNVLLTDAAHGAWMNLPDEHLFIFDEKQEIPTKGIFQPIYGFEVKHHFLPSDWEDAQAKPRRSKTKIDPDEADPKLLKSALDMNPTNFCLRKNL